MDIKQYQAETENTKSDKFYTPPNFIQLLPENQFPVTGPEGLVDISHAIIGIASEAGELLGVIKAAMFYGRPMDMVNLDEEIGDIMWYIGIYCNARATTIEQICETNNKKLRARFPNKFTEEAANNRDLAKERTILEEGSSGRT